MSAKLPSLILKKKLEVQEQNPEQNKRNWKRWNEEQFRKLRK